MKRLEWTPELVGDFWSAVSQTRLAELNFSKLAGSKLLDFLEPYLERDWRCLDFGAGDGDFVRVLIERGYRAAAYELAPGRRENILRQDFYGSPRFLGVVDAETEAEFDCVFMLDTIEHILDDELEAVFDTIKRQLRQDGLLIVTTPNNEDLDLNSVYCPKSGYFFHRWQHVRSFTPDSLSEMLVQFGFERLHDHRVDFSSYGDLAERHKTMTEELELRRRWGLLYFIRKFFHRQPVRGMADLRIGAESNLIYIGRHKMQSLRISKNA